MSDVGQPDRRVWDKEKERERKAAQRARQREQQEAAAPRAGRIRSYDAPNQTPEEEAFWRAFPARPNDLAPSAEALKRLGATTGAR